MARTELNLLVEERRLGTRNQGDVLTDDSLTVESVEHYATTINNAATTYRALTLRRSRVGSTSEHFTFPAQEGELDVIYAHGSTDSDLVSYHFNNRGVSKLLFLEVTCKDTGDECERDGVDYCCDAAVSCDDVVGFEDDLPTIATSCCIANDDDDSVCSADDECCGDFVCNASGTCAEPECFEDGHACQIGDCCERDVSTCALKFFDNFSREERVCCAETVDVDGCVDGGCCGVLVCDNGVGCRIPAGGPCSNDDQCVSGLECTLQGCAQRPTEQPTLSPSRRPTYDPTDAPTRSPSRQPSENPSRAPSARPTRSPTPRPFHDPTRAPTRTPIATAATPAPTRSPTCVATSDPCLSSLGDAQCCSADSVCEDKWSGPDLGYSQVCCVA